MIEPIRIVPLSESAITVEFGDTITPESNQKALALSSSLSFSPFDGMIEAVPAYTSTTIFFDVHSIKQQFPGTTALSSVESIVRHRLSEFIAKPNRKNEIVNIEFSVDEGEWDLNAVAEATRLSVNDVIAIFTSIEYRVYMLGFLPGFAYLGTLDDRLVLPRRNSPRERVPAGSVAIAGHQAGIYPLDSPGGWHIIGRTRLPMFTPKAANVTALQPGMRVRFEAVL